MESAPVRRHLAARRRLQREQVHDGEPASPDDLFTAAVVAVRTTNVAAAPRIAAIRNHHDADDALGTPLANGAAEVPESPGPPAHDAVQHFGRIPFRAIEGRLGAGFDESGVE